MATLNELLQKYVDASYETLLSIANDNFSKLMPVFEEVAQKVHGADNNGGAEIMVPIMCATLAVDGRFTELEYNFFKDLLNSKLSYEEVKSVVAGYANEEGFALVDGIFDSCGPELKSELLSFVLCFLAIDQTISSDETAFIKRLLA